MGAASYIPALRFRRLTPAYDALVAWTMRDDKLKRLLAEQADVGTGSVLDLGCGTGTLALILKRRYPDAEVVGLDADPDVLDIARRKLAAAGLPVRLHQGLAWDADLPNGTFDVVVSSLVFHHLTTGDKHRALVRARQLLRPGGRLHVADWGRPTGMVMRAAFLGVQLLDGFETTRDSVRDRLPTLMRDAGFVAVEEIRREATVFGTLAYYRAAAP
jgi:ubiquinone/menaquinone biosynthesis C-methylase UbiE